MYMCMYMYVYVYIYIYIYLHIYVILDRRLVPDAVLGLRRRGEGVYIICINKT